MKNSNQIPFRRVASGVGVIICQQLSRHSFRTLLARRPESFGLGLGVTGGGFVDNDRLYFEHLPGTVVDTATETWRKAVEKNPGFEEIFSLEHFLERLHPIVAQHVRVDDENEIHATTFYALTVTDKEWSRVLELPSTDTRFGEPFEITVTFTDKVLKRTGNPENTLALYMPDGREPKDSGFHYRHELVALGQIAWHVQEGLLWPPR